MIAAVLRELIAAGVTGDALVTAVERIEAAMVPVVSPGAARQRRYRERHKASRNVTRDADSISSLTKSNLESKKEKKERKQPATIPPDWQPSPRTIAIALDYGFAEREILDTAEDLRLWAQSNAHRPVARKSDWDATLLTWLRKKRRERDEADRNRKPDMADALGRLKSAEESLRRGDGGVYQAWPPTLRVISQG